MEIENYRIITSKRKTISLEIGKEGNLLIRAPLRVTKKYIKKLVEKEKEWIAEKLQKVKERKKACKKKEFLDGEEFLYLGESHKLKIVTGKKNLEFKDEFLLSKDSIDKAREIFIDFYREKAREKITERAIYYSSLTGFTYNKIRITGAQKRWGSCSHKGNLNFTWRLIMAPQKIIDYVVIHELVHIKIKNHSGKFWNKVKDICSDYKIYRKWLKEKGDLLNI
jgi:predicted metal-dependent hydrolase